MQNPCSEPEKIETALLPKRASRSPIAPRLGILKAKPRCEREIAMSDGWLEHVAGEFGIDPALPVDALLDSARVVAHAVERRAAPLTAYLIGVAAASGTADVEELCRRAIDLARGWEPAG